MTTSTNAPSEIHRAPRLSILHLMLWILFAAAELALNRWFLGDLSEDVPRNLLVKVYFVVSSILNGAALMGTAVLVQQRVLGNVSMFRQPGHWILLATSITRLLYIVQHAVLVTAIRSGSLSRTPAYSLLPLAIVALLEGLIYFVALVFAVRVPRWRFVFGGIVAVNLVQALAYLMAVTSSLAGNQWMFSVASLASLLVSLVLVAVALWEQAVGGRRDWLHWLGVSVFVAGGVIPLISSIVNLFTFAG